jgi:hypothetical protein
MNGEKAIAHIRRYMATDERYRKHNFLRPEGHRSSGCRYRNAANSRQDDNENMSYCMILAAYV